MPVYKKRISTRHPRWRNRAVTIMSPNDLAIIPVPDTEVICNGCNRNIHREDEESFGWLIYFDKRSVKLDRPYDVYCDECVQEYYPKAIEVAG